MVQPKKVDANQTQIVKKLREGGCTVADTHSLGHDFPDILVGRNGIMLWVELKNPENKKARLSKGQIAFIEEWRGTPILVATSSEDILIALDELINA